MLSIPGQSAAGERLFSTMNQVDTSDRASLLAEHVEEEVLGFRWYMKRPELFSFDSGRRFAMLDEGAGKGKGRADSTTIEDTSQNTTASKDDRAYLEDFDDIVMTVA
jgi:hypothetical protein